MHLLSFLNLEKCGPTSSPIFQLDHSMITLSVTSNINLRGPGFWKLSTSFLSVKEYIDQVKAIVTEVLSKYRDDKNVNPSLLWELIKLKVREHSLKYANIKKAKLKNTETEMEANILYLEKKLKVMM